MRTLVQLSAVVLAAGVFCGCVSATSSSSVSFRDPLTGAFGPCCSVMSAPLSGDFSRCVDVEGLKKGTSSEVVFFQFEEPLVSAGDESIKSAMRNGGITDLYYADYSIRHFLILGRFTVTAYGK